MRRWMCLALLAATWPGHAQAPAGGPYVISRQVVAAGGTAATGGPYQMVGTAGQAATGPAAAGAIALVSGFHVRAAGTAPPDLMFANGFE